jgi:hypothetical protein
VRQYFSVKTTKSLYFTAIVYLSVPAYLTLGLHFVLQNGLQNELNGAPLGIRTITSYQLGSGHPK